MAMKTMISLADGFKPSDRDVLCGKGKTCLQHPGNLRFRRIVREHLTAYTVAETKDAKGRVVKSVYDAVTFGSRDKQKKEDQEEKERERAIFCRFDQSKNRWFEVTKTMAREKIGQTFRDSLHVHYKSATKSKRRRRKVRREQQREIQVSREQLHHRQQLSLVECRIRKLKKQFDLYGLESDTVLEEAFTESNLDILNALTALESTAATERDQFVASFIAQHGAINDGDDEEGPRAVLLNDEEENEEGEREQKEQVQISPLDESPSRKRALEANDDTDKSGLYQQQSSVSSTKESSNSLATEKDKELLPSQKPTQTECPVNHENTAQKNVEEDSSRRCSLAVLVAAALQDTQGESTDIAKTAAGPIVSVAKPANEMRDDRSSDSSPTCSPTAALHPKKRLKTLSHVPANSLFPEQLQNDDSDSTSLPSDSHRVLKLENERLKEQLLQERNTRVYLLSEIGRIQQLVTCLQQRLDSKKERDGSDLPSWKECTKGNAKKKNAIKPIKPALLSSRAKGTVSSVSKETSHAALSKEATNQSWSREANRSSEGDNNVVPVGDLDATMEAERRFSLNLSSLRSIASANIKTQGRERKGQPSLLNGDSNVHDDLHSLISSLQSQFDIVLRDRDQLYAWHSQITRRVKMQVMFSKMLWEERKLRDAAEKSEKAMFLRLHATEREKSEYQKKHAELKLLMIELQASHAFERKKKHRQQRGSVGISRRQP